MSILNNKTILPGDTIGIIGGGQLGRMMALSAKSLGFHIAVLDPTENCPCGQVADFEINGAYDDLDSIEELARISDVITFEFENINFEALEWLEDHAYVPQGSELLKISQDRLLEKAAISMTGASVAPYFAVNNLHDLYNGIEKVGYPCVLKTARGGYDGKGQLVIRSEVDIAKATDVLIMGKCVLEAWIPFVKEISVIITRKANGDSSCFPVAENIHYNNILDKSIVPARISGQAEAEAIKQAKLLADELELVGTLAVEMFLTAEDEIIINELAPRPHNSGHYTMNACETSQFEQHIRAICNWPLGNTNVLKPVVMVNILGQHLDGLTGHITNLSDWKLHLYGKEEAKHNRKMGHINILRPSIDTALSEINSSGFWNLQTETEDIS
ncbi:5-(carboxyamino)imidazole ribonucleotide synthase [Bacillus sp. V59.32b]|uniref:5-(carboxyamino)imidazole ribonucleotide synthase n=1 Tax=Bacillus sp. V59.32b TaxID=1758642 RepID=UPI0020B12CCC|nr:5-(carboxyamino)imidazole ribonucleotide synthase [Bacillus sp. V59.32b]